MRFVGGIRTEATEGRLFFVSKGQSLAIERRDGAPHVPVGRAPVGAIFLGTIGDEAYFAADASEGPELEIISLRHLFGALHDEEFAVAQRALGLVAWDQDHRHCGRCGAPTERSQTERSRVCTKCGFGVYPRISPAVIMLVEREGKALLARSHRFPVPFFSALAGFVELGETLEETVVREVHEEAGITVTNVRYFGSQPWPLGGSLMVGFNCDWAAGEIVLEDAELAEADWFAPNALPVVPPKLSIARALIDDFVARHAG
ncbi:MAG: NAD(+) diphosphatase [Deltaproteobacteria bacterium]|nr:NAD(+) diphosphatase [Deltaproteobacteria bacterium]